MKKTVFPAICILLCTLFISIIPTEAEAAIYHDTVRLHILAPSDSATDQALKISIRDKILEKYSDYLSGAENSEAAIKTLQAKLGEIQEDCNRWIFELGFSYSADVSLCEEWYNTREYSNFTLPAGYYHSLKITLGEGEGQNWWCVMYPPLCLDCALGEYTEFTDAEYNLISKSGYNIKFKILEVTSSIFGG